MGLPSGSLVPEQAPYQRERQPGASGTGAAAGTARRTSMTPQQRRLQSGRIGWVALWLLGIPIPVLFGLYLLRGCT